VFGIFVFWEEAKRFTAEGTEEEGTEQELRAEVGWRLIVGTHPLQTEQRVGHPQVRLLGDFGSLADRLPSFIRAKQKAVPTKARLGPNRDCGPSKLRASGWGTRV
jgi:hypothetical protein